MNVYSSTRRCPKCRSAAVTTLYCTKQWESFGAATGKFPAWCWRWSEYAPHMHRTCTNCKHEWYERPVDADPADHTPEAIEQRKHDAETEVRALKEQIDALRWPATVTIPAPDKRRRWLR